MIPRCTTTGFFVNIRNQANRGGTAGCLNDLKRSSPINYLEDERFLFVLTQTYGGTMKTRSKPRQKASRSEERKANRLTLMAVQEKLGLFSKKEQPSEDPQDEHDYLKNKPLGLI